MPRDQHIPHSMGPAHRFKRRGQRATHTSQRGTRQRTVGSCFKTARSLPSGHKLFTTFLSRAKYIHPRKIPTSASSLFSFCTVSVSLSQAGGDLTRKILLKILWVLYKSHWGHSNRQKPTANFFTKVPPPVRLPWNRHP